MKPIYFFFLVVLILAVFPNKCLSDLVAETCDRTLYKELWKSILQNQGGTDLQSLAAITLKIVNSRALRSIQNQTNALVKTSSGDVKKVLDDCSENFDDAVSQIKDSTTALSKKSYEDVLMWAVTQPLQLYWFFYLLSSHPCVENEILKEINEKSNSPDYEQVKEMVYIHAALCESMRFYPPVPVDPKQAENDDVWSDETIIKKGYIVIYHIYTMGRLESIWGPDCADYKPERWLQRNIDNEKKWSFVGKDPFSYPVFQAGPRICLGKDMAFLQMKMVVASVLRRFKVVPVFNEGDEEPMFVGYLTAKMKDGFPVRIEERCG